ncbi:hypothetical protein [Actinomycetospora sp. NBC_00405]|uniref:hypothetical protein n=1 Tax=Actinomycetospora sp. NBC_00405 TaxID=2975952 RepID=UPI002E1D71F6
MLIVGADDHEFYVVDELLQEVESSGSPGYGVSVGHTGDPPGVEVIPTLTASIYGFSWAADLSCEPVGSQAADLTGGHQENPVAVIADQDRTRCIRWATELAAPQLSPVR